MLAAQRPYARRGSALSPPTTTGGADFSKPTLPLFQRRAVLNEPVIKPGDEVVSLPQAAKLIGIAPMTMRIWVLEGRLPAREVAGRIVLLRSDVEAYLASNPRGPRRLVKKKGLRRRDG